MARQQFKPPKDPRGGHIRVYWDTFDSVAWSCLGGSSQLAYLALMRQKGSTNNGDLSLPITFAKRYGISSESTLAKALRELVALGLIAVTREGGSTRGGQRLPTLYRFTDIEVYAVPAKFIEASKPTNDWRAITTTEMARAKLEAAEASAAAVATAKKTERLLRNLANTPSKNGVVEPLTPSKNGVWAPGPLRNSKHGKEPQNAANPMPARVAGG